MKLDPALRDAALRQLEESGGERCWHCDVWSPYVEMLEQHRDHIIERLVQQHDPDMEWRLERVERDLRLCEMPVESPWFH